MTAVLSITADVSQDDIDHCQPTNCWECALARAVRREVPGAAKVSVTYVTVYVTWPDGSFSKADLNADARQFVADYSARRAVSPAKFPLRFGKGGNSADSTGGDSGV